MRIERFRHLADLHGAGIERWPMGERAAARDLVAAAPQAARILTEAAALDRLLDASHTRVGDEAVERVLAAVTLEIERESSAPALGPAISPPKSWPRALWPTAGFLVAMGLLGVLSGTLGGVETAPHHEASLATLVTSTSYMIAWGQ